MALLSLKCVAHPSIVRAAPRGRCHAAPRVKDARKVRLIEEPELRRELRRRTVRLTKALCSALESDGANVFADRACEQRAKASVRPGRPRMRSHVAETVHGHYPRSPALSRPIDGGRLSHRPIPTSLDCPSVSEWRHGRGNTVQAAPSGLPVCPGSEAKMVTMCGDLRNGS